LEVVHPNWPTIWPRLLTDGKIVDPAVDPERYYDSLMGFE
jgi:hypothetical protein